MNSWKRQVRKNNEIPEGTYTYEIRIGGKLRETWSNWFENMKITYEKGATVLTGKVVDEAALRGILSRIWDLNLILISVRRLEKNVNKET